MRSGCQFSPSELATDRKWWGIFSDRIGADAVRTGTFGVLNGDATGWFWDRRRLRALWNELESVLEDLDPRWLKFIDRIPGDPRVPEQVEDVTAEAQPGGIILVDWEDTTRAASYKVLKQIVGVDPEPVLFTTVDDSDAQITDVPSGATVRLQIVATNAVGDAPASEVVQLQAA